MEVEKAVNDSIGAVFTGASWSGNERNHVYFGGLEGSHFEELSAISGLDDPGDTRGFAQLDFDRDGWLDIALPNLNAPRLRLLRNRFGDAGSKNRFIALRLVGGNWSAEPSSDWSARSAFGTRVEVTLGTSGTIVRELRVEDGMNTQNSSTMRIGIGGADRAAAVVVRWPSGRRQRLARVRAGSLLTVYEDPRRSPTRSAFVVETYAR